MLFFICLISVSFFLISFSFCTISTFRISSLSASSLGYSVASGANSALLTASLSGIVVLYNNSASTTSLLSFVSFEVKSFKLFVNLFEGTAPLVRDALCANILSSVSLNSFFRLIKFFCAVLDSSNVAFTSSTFALYSSILTKYS